MMRRALLALLAAALATVAPAAAQEQAAECDPVDLLEVQELWTVAGDFAFVQGPFFIRCSNGAELRANQGTLNRPAHELLLVGNISYRDSVRTLTADQATYTSTTRRLYATGNVVFTNLTEGTTIRGPELEYFATSPTRPEAQVNAGSRPHLTLMPRDTAGSQEPLEIDADRLSIVGNDDLTAFGNVIIERTDLDASADEVRYAGEREHLELRGNATVKGKENVLRGKSIDAQLENDALKEVHSRGDAELEAKDMRVTAPDVHLFFKDELVERTIARSDSTAPTQRPLAVTKTFRLVADSIDAVAPKQELETVTAIGRARGETIDTLRAPPVASDSARSEGQSLIESDWIAGDTIVGYFTKRDSVEAAATTEPGDTAVELEKIVARGTALSLYHLQGDSTAAPADGAPADSAAASQQRKGLNFVSAQMITLTFKEGEVEMAELFGVKRGIYLDPRPGATAAAGGAPPATTSAPPGAGRE